MDREFTIGRRVLRLDAVDSTNERAKEILDEGVEEGTVVLAKRQAAGRGRYGRVWASPPGGVYLSIVLRPDEVGVLRLSLLSGIPVVRTLSGYGLSARLKWPNDVLVGSGKIGGILCEGVYRRDSFYAVVGIGLNTDVDLRRLPGDVQEVATSMRRERGESVDNDSFVEELLAKYQSFYNIYRKGDFEQLMQEYRRLCVTLGEEVVVETTKGSLRGRAIDVSDNGVLVLDSEGRKVDVYEGTVYHVAAKMRTLDH